MKNSVDELQTLQRLHVSGRPSKASRILEVNWCPPPPGCLKVNTDGAAFGSLGLVGYARIKTDFYQAIKEIDRGIFGVPSAKKSEIDDLVKLLESQNPTPYTTSDLEKEKEAERCLWTAFILRFAGVNLDLEGC
ncbi:hypothetical protein Q3G72_035134 [Acer saccharum]|nr:hypothetical protein Q3G72_035134 [Acer saccharum]